MHRAPTRLNGEAYTFGISRATRPCDRARHSAAMPRLPSALTRCDGSYMHARRTPSAGSSGRSPAASPGTSLFARRVCPQRFSDEACHSGAVARSNWRGPKLAARGDRAGADIDSKCTRPMLPATVRRAICGGWVCCALRWQLVCKLRLTYAMMC